MKIALASSFILIVFVSSLPSTSSRECAGTSNKFIVKEGGDNYWHLRQKYPQQGRNSSAAHIAEMNELHR